MKTYFFKATCVAALLAGTMATADRHLPLKTLPDDAERDYWVPEQVNADGTLDALQAVVYNSDGATGSGLARIAAALAPERDPGEQIEEMLTQHDRQVPAQHECIGSEER